jgi:DNA-binding XRE family transcriptional regulator
VSGSSPSLSPLAGPRPIRRQLAQAAGLLAARLSALEAELPSSWSEYLATAVALAALVEHLTPASGELLTTRDMAERLGISSKTLLRRKRNGQATPALTLGRRGRAAIRWSGWEVR